MAPTTLTPLLEPDPEKITRLDKLIGALCLVFFLVTWISSVTSPFLFGLAIFYEYYATAASMAAITAIAYLPWKKGIISNSFGRFMGHFIARYFKSIQILVEGDSLPAVSQQNADPQQQQQQQERQTFYAIHPHGAFCIGWSMLFCHADLQNVRFCFAPFLFGSPFFRLFSRCTGNPGSAAKPAMVAAMKRGEHMALPPGGFEEATLTSTAHDRVFIKKRTGFIRLCLQHGGGGSGMAVRPVYVFGEKSLYWNIQGMFGMRLALNRYGLPAIVTWGHALFPLLPRNTVDIRIVVGAPLQLPHIAQPTQEDVKKWHDKYVAALVKLFEDHKEMAYGPEEAKTAKLEVW